ncbi:response regulator [Desulfobulbus oligotrophicus]|jgi:signal transduction histidine kinase/CheY-like chemotaxis protein|uniref:histidine kinase n=1 Tax=Desulfobulbus oligotrophicus TaxID=1909699 RepID=A0A7T5VEY4_9BACT|nr:response regulator [Desulfobulbus oligotrophicus]MDY0391609.1 response regulator [Desulfobulbus oligotrophicus]QQG66649.1 response regulator [Desulfobulbus oligotrophicus]
MHVFPFNKMHKDSDSETIRRVLLLSVFLGLGIFLLVAMGVVAFVQNAVWLAFADFVTASLVFLLLVYLYKTGDEPTASRVGVFAIGVFFCVLFFIGGVSATAFMWLYTFPLLSLYLLGMLQGIAAALVLCAFCAGFLAVDLSSDLLNVYTRDFAIRFIPSYLVVCVLAFLVEKSRYESWKAMFDKQQLLSQTVQELQIKEAELQESRNNLELRVSQRTEELEQANEQLRIEIKEREEAQQEQARLEADLLRAQKMETLGRLAGGVAHDLNNVLSGIVNYPELLLLKLPPDDEMRGPLQSIRRAGLKAAAIVQDLLALARRAITIKENVYLNDIITTHLQSLEYISLQNQYPDVVLTVDLDPDLHNIFGSAVHLEKVIMNLLVNSFEAVTNEGKILLKTENRYVDHPVYGFETVQPGQYVLLIITDNGIGIPAESLNLIFEPFYSSKEIGHSGTGLGMTVVWGTVKDLDGYLDVVSQADRGTTITLYLPVHEGVENEPDTKQLPAIMRGNGETLLLVDDEPEQRILGQKLLSILGYTMETVSSGEEALEFLKDHAVDLVLLDMIMGTGLDGLDTYRRILETRPEQKVVIVSGYAETERTRIAMDLGANGYIQKPYTLENLSTIIYGTIQS